MPPPVAPAPGAPVTPGGPTNAGGGTGGPGHAGHPGSARLANTGGPTNPDGTPLAGIGPRPGLLDPAQSSGGARGPPRDQVDPNAGQPTSTAPHSPLPGSAVTGTSTSLNRFDQGFVTPDANGNLGYGNRGNNNNGLFNTGDNNAGDLNQGNNNVGVANHGSFNRGNDNTGLWNHGNNNTGLFNTGNGNTGFAQAGNRNSGALQTGNGNAGALQAGDANHGFANVGDRNSGVDNFGTDNTGNGNFGARNHGTLNFGADNTGNGNVGARNHGTLNLGTDNTGNGNIGGRNRGDLNVGLDNTGFDNFGLDNRGNNDFGAHQRGDWQGGHDFLDTVSYFPGANIPASVGNAGWYAKDGDWGNAAGSMVNIVPLARDAKGVKQVGELGIRNSSRLRQFAETVGRSLFRNGEITAEPGRGKTNPPAAGPGRVINRPNAEPGAQPSQPSRTIQRPSTRAGNRPSGPAGTHPSGHAPGPRRSGGSNEMAPLGGGNNPLTGSAAAQRPGTRSGTDGPPAPGTPASRSGAERASASGHDAAGSEPGVTHGAASRPDHLAPRASHGRDGEPPVSPPGTGPRSDDPIGNSFSNPAPATPGHAESASGPGARTPQNRLDALGDLTPSTNKHDPAAHLLAERINGQPQVSFSKGPNPNQEFDAVSDRYVAQSKPGGFQLGKQFRRQAQTTFEVAKSTGRRPYFHFEGPPAPGVIDKPQEYGTRYGLDPVIDIKPLAGP
jgi:hypothetical protein